jgi:MFS family permease
LSRSSAPVIYAAILLIWTAQNLWPTLLPVAANAVGLSTSDIGWILAIPNALVVLLAIPIASFSDRHGRGSFVAAGAATGVAGAIAPVVWTGPIGLILCACAVGILWVCSVSLVLAELADSVSVRSASRAQAHNAGIQALAAFAGPSLAAAAIGLFGVRSGLGVLALLAAALLPVALRMSGGRSESPMPGVVRGYRDARAMVLSRAAIRLPALQSVLFTGGALVVTGSFLPLLLVREGWRPEQAIAVVGLRGLAALLPFLVFERLIRSLGAPRVAVAATALTVVPIALVFVSFEPVVVVALFIAQGIGVGIMPAASNLLITLGSAPAERGVAFAAVAVSGRLAAIVLPPAVGAIGDLFDLQTALFGSLVLLLALFGWLVVTASSTSIEGVHSV